MENECTALVVYEPPRFILFMVYFHENVRAMAAVMVAPLFAALTEMAHGLAAFAERE